MKILLINNNPVVSRLTALSARKEDIEIDEIQEVTELSSDTYDIVFVDADSWTKDVRDVISENIKTQKSVLFYGDGDEEEKVSFDLSILKPFLPSEVSAVIRSVEETGETLIAPAIEENHFNILDDAKVDSRDDLFDLDGLDEVVEKKEEIKEKASDVSFDAKLEEAFPLKVNTLDDDLFENEFMSEKSEEKVEEKKTEEKKTEEKVKEDNDLFDLDLSDDLPSLEDNLFTEDKKDEVLEVANELEKEPALEEELALEIDEPVVQEVKKETQVLDELEIENIKGILTEDVSPDMTLEDLMPPVITTPVVEVKSKEIEVSNDNIHVDSEELVQTLSSMPIEGLRELLAGAKVNIKIKFPKSKK